MVKTLNGAIATVSQDTARIQRAYDKLRAENIARDRALTNLSEIVKEYGSSPGNRRPHPVIQADVLDEEGNLRAADIGIIWENNETFLHGVRVVGPGPPRPTGMGPVMSTPYQPMRGQDRDNTSTTALPPTPRTPEMVPDSDIQICRPPPETRQGYRSAAPIQRFNNKSLNWLAWFRHFRAVAVGDRPPWTNRRPPDASGVPTLQQMFALARRMGYEMCPIARQTDAPRQQPGSRPPVDQNLGFRSQPRTGRDYSRDQVFQLRTVWTYAITLPAAGCFLTV